MAARLPWLLALLVSVAACGRARASDCVALNTAINAGVARLDAHEAERRQHEGGSAQTARDMRQAAGLYRQSITEIEALGVSDAEVRSLEGEYVASLRSVAGSANALATALEQGRPDDAHQADELYLKMLERQKRAVERINAACTR